MKDWHEIEDAEKWLYKFYNKLCSKIYGNHFRRKGITPFELILFPEYPDKLHDNHLHWHGCIKINPDKMDLLKENIEQVWVDLDETTRGGTFFREDKNKTSIQPVSFEWKSYMREDYTEHKVYYHFQ